jgi:gliding motility associated protien GldN
MKGYFIAALLLFSFGIGNSQVQYASVREADIMWGKRIWRKIDLREKMNHPLYFSHNISGENISLIGIIRDGIIKHNTLTAYDYFNENFSKPLSASDVASMGVYIDTIEIESPNPPYTLIKTSIYEDFKPEHIVAYLIKEEWYFDKQRSVMDVRILAICPVMEVYRNGEYRGTQNMFWVNFAQLRNVLSQYKTFNPHNPLKGLSYDDIFIQRLFSSFIYKEDNVHDRKIEEYLSGIDAILESEKISNNLRIWEENLWEY